MKFSIFIIFTSLLLVKPIFAADAIDFRLGFFNMEFNPIGREYLINYGSGWEKRHIPNSRAFIDAPICYAISNQKNLEIVVELNEYINMKEKKIVTKRLTVEPHVIGYTQEGTLELRGKITREEMLKSVTIKYREDKFVDPIDPREPNDKDIDESEDGSEEYTTFYDTGFFRGEYFSSGKNYSVEIKRIKWIKVLKKSHFELPKSYKLDNRNFIKIICQLPEVKGNNETAVTAPSENLGKHF
ncbi:MAG: hypothetical protein H0T62_00880 [Parachlamydiaceae bacterium]|nr:hypothetical protein [Parachlamydiaceae bacterium]